MFAVFLREKSSEKMTISDQKVVKMSNVTAHHEDSVIKVMVLETIF